MVAEPPSTIKWMMSRRDFRARAHSNPLSDSNYAIPSTSAKVPWSKYLHKDLSQRQHPIDWLDIGCGYGGLLVRLATEYPEKIMIGMEIRDRVCEYCLKRLEELRRENTENGKVVRYGNLGYVRLNVMKYLTCWFAKGSLEKIFFCYPDPHFKKSKWRQRIVSRQLLSEYAYVLRTGAVAYVVTDVEDLFVWIVERFEKFPVFERREREEEEKDPVVPFVRDKTDEAQRVVKGKREKFLATFRRLPDPPEESVSPFTT